MKCSNDKSGCKTSGCCKAKCFKIALVAIVGIAALGWLVMLLWNWLMPDLFVGVKQIGYWQALGIFLLSKILLGGCHGHGRWKGRHQHWENMTPEEREKLKGHFRSRWSHWCSSGQADSNEGKAVEGSVTDGE